VSLGLVRDAVRERFDAAIISAMRLRDSVFAELLLIAVVYGVGILVVWRHYGALGTPTWYATPDDGALRQQLAGWWYLLVSLPLFQFVLLRWYFRRFVWARFLWHVSRMDIAYAPMHPDRSRSCCRAWSKSWSDLHVGGRHRSPEVIARPPAPA